MRTVLFLACALLLGGTVVAAPSATACTGDPSVCGLVQDAKCTLREKTDALNECHGFIGPYDASSAWDACVPYAFAPDHHWSYACVDPAGGTCAVYLKERHGTTETRYCLIAGATTTTDAGAPEACVPLSGGLDYPTYLCVDGSNAKCAVYVQSTTDWGTSKRCYGVIPAP